MTTDNKKGKLLSILLCGLIVLALIAGSVWLYKQNVQKNQKLAVAQAALKEAQEGIDWFKNKYEGCASTLSTTELDFNGVREQFRICTLGLNTCQKDVATCNQELKSLKQSKEYTYSSKIFPNDPTIKQLAVQNLKAFDESPDCLSYSTKCVLVDQNNDCIETEKYCSRFSDNHLFYTLDYANGLQQYYMKVVMSNYLWVRDNVVYSLDYQWDKKTPQTALETLSIHAGNCNEMTTLLASLIMSSGVKARPVILPEINHMILAVTFDGIETLNLQSTTLVDETTYLLLDPTCKWCKIGTLPEMDRNQSFSLLGYYEVNK